MFLSFWHYTKLIENFMEENKHVQNKPFYHRSENALLDIVLEQIALYTRLSFTKNVFASGSLNSIYGYKDPLHLKAMKSLKNTLNFHFIMFVSLL